VLPFISKILFIQSVSHLSPISPSPLFPGGLWKEPLKERLSLSVSPFSLLFLSLPFLRSLFYSLPFSVPLSLSPLLVVFRRLKCSVQGERERVEELREQDDHGQPQRRQPQPRGQRGEQGGGEKGGKRQEVLPAGGGETTRRREEPVAHQ